MAEPMSAGEIEDVLASIRRLVSQDGRATRPEVPPPAAAAPKPAPSKLLLTPALRVVEPARPLPPSPPPAPAAEDDTWADEDAMAAPGPQSTPAPSTPAPSTPASAAPPRAAPSQAAAVAATIARLVPDWEDEGSPPGRLSWVDVAESLEDEPAEPPRFVHRAAAAPPPPEPEQPALIATTEDVLDEAVLREIVREVLREELQGHLGERITRNIRKLVRAEVYRSLTLRDFN